MSGDFPRLLFVTGAAFNKVTGGGITFTNLFQGWPKDRIATVTNDAVPVSTEICDRYFHLNGEIARLGAPHLPGSTRQSQGGPAAALPRRPAWVTRAKTLVVGNAFPDRGWLSPELAAFVDDFRPQVIFTILGPIGTMELVDAIRRHTGAPLVVHFMDDWAATLYRGGLLAPWLRARMNTLLRRLVRAAHLRLGIGTYMCQAYEQRFGAPFQAFQNTVEPRRLAQFAPRAASAAASPARLVYCGSIFSNAQSDSLIDTAAAIGRLNGDGLACRLEIYAPPFLSAPFRDRLLAHQGVSLHDTVTDDDAFFQLIGGADALVLPVNFDRESATFIRYSMPTKLPAYLASGTPILGYGPPEVAQLAVLADQQCGLVVGRRDGAALDAALRRLFTDGTLRAALSARAVALAAERHDADAVRGAFQAALRQVAS